MDDRIESASRRHFVLGAFGMVLSQVHAVDAAAAPNAGILDLAAQVHDGIRAGSAETLRTLLRGARLIDFDGDGNARASSRDAAVEALLALPSSLVVTEGFVSSYERLATVERRAADGGVRDERICIYEQQHGRLSAMDRLSPASGAPTDATRPVDAFVSAWNAGNWEAAESLLTAETRFESWRRGYRQQTASREDLGKCLADARWRERRNRFPSRSEGSGTCWNYRFRTSDRLTAGTNTCTLHRWSAGPASIWAWIVQSDRIRCRIDLDDDDA